MGMEGMFSVGMKPPHQQMCWLLLDQHQNQRSEPSLDIQETFYVQVGNVLHLFIKNNNFYQVAVTVKMHLDYNGRFLILSKVIQPIHVQRNVMSCSSSFKKRIYI